MLKKFTLSFLFFVVVLFGAISLFTDMFESKKEPVKVIKKSSISKEYRYRKFSHVKSFYEDIAKNAVELGIKYSVPPAALLAIAGVESGYGRGYVAHITGNILSLGAKQGENQLPSLYLPNLKSDSSKVLYGSMITKYKDSELVWKQREKSLKKDYRPKSMAGTSKKLDFLDKNPLHRAEAHRACMEDFVKVWISRDKKFKPFVDARVMLDEQVKLHGEDVLFSKELNTKFIYMISGKKNSFNYRKTWAPKVLKVMENTGLRELTEALHVEGIEFKQAWD